MVTDIFKFDPKYLKTEERCKSIKAEILGEDSENESESGSDKDNSERRKVTCSLSASFDKVDSFWLISSCGT